jgi:hypothetical protein
MQWAPLSDPNRQHKKNERSHAVQTTKSYALMIANNMIEI